MSTASENRRHETKYRNRNEIDRERINSKENLKSSKCKFEITEKGRKILQEKFDNTTRSVLGFPKPFFLQSTSSPLTKKNIKSEKSGDLPLSESSMLSSSSISSISTPQ
ncbi:MAG: hypothetical protein MHPSP_001562, partial [Paramarteilia canceri]